MEKLGLILAFYTFIGCLWWLITKVSGPFLFKLFSKSFGITGCVLSFIYILKYFNFL